MTDMIPTRIFYRRQGRVRYISHLDTVRAMTRALRRSGLKLWYTQGFNPHLYLTFALPISLGYESEYEVLDIRLTEPTAHDMVKSRLNGVLPPGFEVFRVAQPILDPKVIAWADYQITLQTEDPSSLSTRFEDMMNEPHLMAVKKTKKGEKEIDLLPMVKQWQAVPSEHAVSLLLRVSAGVSENLNPALLLRILEQKSMKGPLPALAVRTALLIEDESLFE